jgi:NADPH2:quinone reductase
MVCRALTGPAALALETLPLRDPGPGELRVRIGAAGINYPDLLMTRGTYQYRPDLPFVPGLEGAGLVEALGSGVHGFELGQRVLFTARCGLFASHAVVSAEATFAAPAGFTMPEAACFRAATHTARHALIDRATLKPGESVLVLGAAGGVGLASVEIAALLGARVIAAASSPQKLAVAAARGARHLVDYSLAPLVDQVRALAPDGVDVIVDPVGGELAQEALRLAAWNGRFLVTGFASGRIANVAANRVLLRGFSLIGVRAGEAVRRDPALGARSAAQLAAWAAEGHLRPHLCATLPLERAAQGLQMLESRQAIGRVALVADAGIS